MIGRPIRSCIRSNLQRGRWRRLNECALITLQFECFGLSIDSIFEGNDLGGFLTNHDSDGGAVIVSGW